MRKQVMETLVKTVSNVSVRVRGTCASALPMDSDKDSMTTQANHDIVIVWLRLSFLYPLAVKRRERGGQKFVF